MVVENYGLIPFNVNLASLSANKVLAKQALEATWFYHECFKLGVSSS